MKEAKTGLELKELRGGVRLDTAFTHVTLPGVVLRTADSDIEGEVDLDFNAFDAQNSGKLRARLNAQIGKQGLFPEKTGQEREQQIKLHFHGQGP